MKKLIAIFIFLAFACTKEEVSSQVNLGESITAEYAKTVEIKDAISLKVSNVEDSRCPKNVQCPWAGLVNVSLNVSDKSASKDIKIEFSAKSSKGEAELNGQKYIFEIKDVTPYPETTGTVDKSKYKVILVVTKA